MPLADITLIVASKLSKITITCCDLLKNIYLCGSNNN